MSSKGARGERSLYVFCRKQRSTAAAFPVTSLAILSEFCLLVSVQTIIIKRFKKA